MGSFPMAPGMVNCGGGSSPSGLIEKYLGEAYANVLTVAEGMPDIQTLLVNLASIQAVATLIGQGVDFHEATWGQIIGTLTDQADLTTYVTNRLSNYQVTSPVLAALSQLTFTGNADKVIKVTHDETGAVFSFDEIGTGTVTGVPVGNYGDVTSNPDSTLTVNSVGGQTAATIAGWAAGKINITEKGAANGVCPLDATSKIAAVFLPSYVDDVIEVATITALPGVGETGKIYVTIDTKKIYRWSGTVYIELDPAPGSTDAVVEGATNLYFTNARAQAAVTAALAGKADLVGGRVAAAQLPTNVAYFTVADGGMEVGSYIDFHTTADGFDYQARMQANASGFLDISTRGGTITISASDFVISTNGKALKFLGASGSYSYFINQTDGNFVFYSTHADGTARSVWSIATHSDTSVFTINPDVSMAGNLVVTGEITSPSDIRLKTDITPILNASEIISLLGGYRFIMDGREQVGVIAQQVLKVLPELIVEDLDGFLSVNYAKLTAVLVADNNALRGRLSRVEARLDRLEGR